MGKAWCSNDSKKALKRAQKMTTEGLILLETRFFRLMTFDQLPIEIKPLVFRCK